MNVKSAGEAAEKHARVCGQRSQDFESGVRNPRKDWATQTAGAEGAYEAGVQEAIASNRFSRGVSEVGTPGWQEPTLAKGVQRWGPGCQAGRAKYQRGIEKVLNTLQGITLPPRFARGDPRNLDRVRVISERLHALRTGK